MYQLHSSPLILHSFSHMLAIGKVASGYFRTESEAVEFVGKVDDLIQKCPVLLLTLWEMMQAIRSTRIY